MPDRNIQKILIKPPLSGLNIHDNPLDLSFMFATELVNFLPPTTKLMVRPGIENIMLLDGMPLGIYSYNVGARKLYRTGLLITMPSLSTPAYSSILIKCSQANGLTAFYSVNPLSREKVHLETFRSTEYSGEYCMHNNSMFFTDGSNNSAPYIYSGTRGISQLVWLGPTGTTDENKDITDLDNMTAYNGWIFANSVGSLNIHYMSADTADPDAENQKAWIERIFKPQVTGTWSLTGFNKLGGSILKMFTLGSNQNDTIAQFLCVMTDQGELLVYQGKSPADVETWRLQGIFRIPIPLNKRCFCQVEGDMIIATQMGIVSLQRVVFGTKTQITEALEWRISELFFNYEFRTNAYRRHFFLKYHAKSRELILNVPEFVPIRLYDVVRGYVFNKYRMLCFDADAFDTVDARDVLLGFITNYILKRQLSYYIKYTFNADRDLGINLSFSVYDIKDNPEVSGITSAKLKIEFSITTDQGTTHFLKHNNLSGWIFEIKNIYSDIVDKNNIVAIGAEDTWAIPSEMININGINTRCYVYRFVGDKVYEVTDVRPSTVTFGGDYGTHDLNEYRLDIAESPSPFRVIDAADVRLYTKMSIPYKDQSTLAEGNYPFGGLSEFPSFTEMATWLLNRTAPLDQMPTISGSHYPINFYYLIRSAFANNAVGSGDMSGDWSYDSVLSYTWGTMINFRDSTEALAPIGISLVGSVNVGLAFYQSNTGLQGDKHCTWQFNGTLEAIMIDGDGKNNRIFYATIDEDVRINYDYDWTRKWWQQDHKNFTVYNPGDDIATKQIGGYRMSEGHVFESGIVTTDIIGHSPNWPASQDPIVWLKENLPKYKAANPVDEYNRHRDDEDYGDITAPPITRNYNYNRYLGCLESYLYVSGQNTNSSFKESANFDLSVVPFISYTNVIGMYKSTQYVFDTHYGTWSQWKDVDMVDAVEHQDEFYFVRMEPKVLAKNAEEISRRCMLCKFNPDYNGDFEDEEGNYTPIVATYQAGHTDLALGHSRKQFKKVKILGTAPVFWGQEVGDNPPFTFKFETDFVPQADVKYPYYGYSTNPDNDGKLLHPVMKAFREKYGIIKSYKDLTYMEKKMYLKLYAEIAQNVKSIELPLVSGPCDRISMGCKLEVTEHNLIIYGYELFYEVVNP